MECLVKVVAFVVCHHNPFRSLDAGRISSRKSVELSQGSVGSMWARSLNSRVSSGSMQHRASAGIISSSESLPSTQMPAFDAEIVYSPAGEDQTLDSKVVLGRSPSFQRAEVGC